jgi:uncharacterized membrane protein
MGLLASFCWLGSFYGHKSWSSSWIQILHYHEGLYLEKSRVEKPDDYRVYSLVVEDAVKKRGFSTPTITGIFIWIVIFGWSILLIKEILPLFINLTEYECFYKCICIIIVFIAAIYAVVRLIKWKNLLSNIDRIYRLKIKEIDEIEKIEKEDYKYIYIIENPNKKIKYNKTETIKNKQS